MVSETSSTSLSPSEEGSGKTPTQSQSPSVTIESLQRSVQEVYLQYAELISALHEITDANLKVKGVLNDYVDVKKTTSEMRGKVNKMTGKVKALTLELNQIKIERIRTIEVLSVFVALITFVSAEVNLIKDSPAWVIIGMSLILAGVLVVFVLLVNLVSRNVLISELILDEPITSQSVSDVSVRPRFAHHQSLTIIGGSLILTGVLILAMHEQIFGQEQTKMNNSQIEIMNIQEYEPTRGR